jgi:putative transposase
MAHKASRALVDDLQARLFVFEDLRTKNMTRSAKGTVDKPGRNVRQKAGLNRAILHSAWGRIHQLTRYKARRMGKLAIAVPPHHSSQECRLCGFTAPGNRLTQAEFACQRCGHAENADFNAAGVVKLRGVRLLLAGEIEFKTPRRSGIRKQLGPERSEVTPGEKVSVVREQTPQTPSSLNRETPTTTPTGVWWRESSSAFADNDVSIHIETDPDSVSGTAALGMKIYPPGVEKNDRGPSFEKFYPWIDRMSKDCMV